MAETSGPAIELGNAKESLLYGVIAHEREPGMPYKADKLPDALIARFADWIDTRAPYARMLRHPPQPAQPAANDEGKILFTWYVRCWKRRA